LSVAEPNMPHPQIFCGRHFRGFFPKVSLDETAFVRGVLRRQLQECRFEASSIRPFDRLNPTTPAVLFQLFQRWDTSSKRLGR
jgi:hypothetical protein